MRTTQLLFDLRHLHLQRMDVGLAVGWVFTPRSKAQRIGVSPPVAPLKRQPRAHGMSRRAGYTYHLNDDPPSRAAAAILAWNGEV